jgi:hypothetical protein
MSLKDLAQQMKSRGRNGDTELIHMTKGEVAGLQQLAEAAGGTLTINPDTGLPEASFLEKLISSPLFAPLAGAGLMMVPGVGPLMAAGLVGGGTALATGDVGRGAMAGLGAYGGAGIGAGLGTAAAPAATAQALSNPALAGQAIATGGTSQAGMLAAQNAGFGAEGTRLLAQAAGGSAPTAAGMAGQGIQALGNEGGRTAFMEGVGGLSGLAKSGAMGAAPLLYDYLMPRNTAAAEMPAEEEDTEDLMNRYEYVPGYTGGTRAAGAPFTSEARYFDPEFRPRFTAAQGGAVKKFADGGEASASSSEFDPARGMTGQSAESMRYLYDMGQGPGSSGEALDYLYGRVPAFTPAVQAPAQQTPFTPPTRAQQTLPFRSGSGENDPMKDYQLIGSGPYAGLYESKRPQYAFDPGSQQYYRTDPVFKQQTFFGGLFNGFRNADYDSHLNPFGFTGGYAKGGITSLADGGFVLAADIPSAVGEGNTEAGYREIAEVLPGAMPIRGKDKGQADTVKTSIEGKQPARVAHGEMYVPPETVKKAGGAKKLYAMMDKVREQATGNKKQIKPVDIRKALA